MKRKQAPLAAKSFAAAILFLTCVLTASSVSAQSGPYDNYRCGHNGNKVQICHIPPGNPENAHEIYVGEPSVEAHLAHGDKLGTCEVSNPGGNPIVAEKPASGNLYDNYRCGNNDKKVLICHIPPGNPENAHEICVGEPSVDAHLAHGDVLGSCPTGGGNPGGNPITSDEMEAGLGNAHKVMLLPAGGSSFAVK
jgi:hypothetical protein